MTRHGESSLRYGAGIIDTCINNDCFGKPNAWKARLPLVAFRSLAMQAAIESYTATSPRRARMLATDGSGRSQVGVSLFGCGRTALGSWRSRPQIDCVLQCLWNEGDQREPGLLGQNAMKCSTIKPGIKKCHGQGNAAPSVIRVSLTGPGVALSMRRWVSPVGNSGGSLVGSTV